MKACWAVVVCALCACGRRDSSAAPDPGAPSASVVAIGVGPGTCDDIRACEDECDAGSADRCRRLAATYAFAKGAARNEARAALLYEQACAMSDAAACVFAGQMHEYAHGVPKDDTRAAAFYARACAMGWAAGCYNEAIMLENGRGVPEDRAKARERYEVACSAGAREACDKAKAFQRGDAGP